MTSSANETPANSSRAENEPEPAANAGKRRKVSRRVWCFRIMAILFPFFALFLTESILRWSEVGIDSSLVLPSDRDPEQKVHFLNPRVDVAYCSIDLRGPEPRGFEMPRPAESMRVLVVGASTVQGYPYPSELAFPKQLELLLEHQFPAQDIEILNAGIIGLSTTPLVDLVSQAAQSDPSLIVLYAGHNEFYGVGGVSTNAEISNVGIRFRQFRFGQVLSDYFSSPEEPEGNKSSELISRLPQSYQIQHDSELIRKAEQTYRRNLERICRICHRHKIPLLVCSVVSKLRNQSPVVSSADSELIQELDLKISPLIENGNYPAACNLLRELSMEHPVSAVLQYRLAQCLEESGRLEEASQAYIEARDLDVCRYRAPSSFTDIVRQVTSEADGKVSFLDLGSLFDQHSSDTVPGDDLFLEHVHFTIEGHWLAANCIARKIVEDHYHGNWDESRTPSEQERDDWLGLIPQDRVVGNTLAYFICQTPPFDEALDAEVHVKLLAEKMTQLTNSMSEPDQQIYTSLSNGEKMNDLVDGIGRVWLSMGENEKALEQFQRSIRRRPWMPNGYVFSAICCHLLGRDSEALEYLKESQTTIMSETTPLLRDKNQLLNALRTTKARDSGTHPIQ